MALSVEVLGNLFCGEEPGDVDSWERDAWSPAGAVAGQETALETIDFPVEDDQSIDWLLDRESDHLPESGYLERFQNRSLDDSARRDAINWMLKVHEFYNFGPVTAYLSFNYFDRFLSSHTLPQGNGWPFQLLSVACLSLAAKMEETHVPPLLDLQVAEPRFIFEARTIKRMELLVVVILKWRMRSITPFNFLGYFVNKLDSEAESTFLNRLYSRAIQLIISTNQVIDFLGFRPSSIAAAAVLCAAAEESSDFDAGVDRKTATFFSRISKDMVSSCHSLMQELLMGRCLASRKISAGEQSSLPAPPSPVGVLDAAACGSCDTQKSDQPGVASSLLLNKRRKLSNFLYTED